MGLFLSLSRSQIKEAVAGFSKLVAGKFVVPVLGCIRFEKTDRGIIAQATNLDEAAQYRFSTAQAEGEGAFIVPLASLRELTKGRDADMIDFDASNGTTVFVTNPVGAHAVRLPISGMELAEWPDCYPPETATEPSEGFLETYRRLIPFTSTIDTSRVQLTGVFVDAEHTDEHGTAMVATDGRRLSLWNAKSIPLTQSITVPSTKFLQWTGLTGDVRLGLRTVTAKEKVSVLGLALDAGPWAYDVKPHSGIYPNFRQVIPSWETGENTSRMTFTNEDAVALKRILPSFPGGGSKGDGVFLRRGDQGSLVIVGRNPGDADATHLELMGGSTIEGTLSGICVNAAYLLDALDAGFRVFATASDSVTPLRSEDGHGGTHVLMPLRFVGRPAKQEESAEAPEQPVAPVEAAEAIVEPTTTPTPSPAIEPIEPVAETQKGFRPMTNDTNTSTEQTSALDQALAAIDAAKSKLREATFAIADVSVAVKAAAKEGKVKETEVRKAQEIIGKLQAISLKAA